MIRRIVSIFSLFCMFNLYSHRLPLPATLAHKPIYYELAQQLDGFSCGYNTIFNACVLETQFGKNNLNSSPINFRNNVIPFLSIRGINPTDGVFDLKLLETLAGMLGLPNFSCLIIQQSDTRFYENPVLHGNTQYCYDCGVSQEENRARMEAAKIAETNAKIDNLIFQLNNARGMIFINFACVVRTPSECHIILVSVVKNASGQISMHIFDNMNSQIALDSQIMIYINYLKDRFGVGEVVRSMQTTQQIQPVASCSSCTTSVNLPLPQSLAAKPITYELVKQIDGFSCGYNVLFNACNLETRFGKFNCHSNLTNFSNCVVAHLSSKGIHPAATSSGVILEPLAVLLNLQNFTYLMFHKDNPMAYKTPVLCGNTSFSYQLGATEEEISRLMDAAVIKRATDRFDNLALQLDAASGLFFMHFGCNVVSLGTKHLVLVSIVKNANGERAMYIFDNMNQPINQDSQIMVYIDYLRNKFGIDSVVDLRLQAVEEEANKIAAAEGLNPQQLAELINILKLSLQ